MTDLLQVPLPRVALIDANVLFAPRLCDLFMHLHLEGAIRIHWTSAINEEWTRNAALKTAGDTAGIYRRRDAMTNAIPGWEVSSYDTFLDRCTGVDAKDRHVSAAALKLRREEDDDVALVTENIRHFPAVDFEGSGVHPVTPSVFLRMLHREEPTLVVSVAERCRTKLRSVPRSQEEYVALLMKLGCELAQDLGHAWDVPCLVRLADGTLIYRED